MDQSGTLPVPFFGLMHLLIYSGRLGVKEGSWVWLKSVGFQVTPLFYKGLQHLLTFGSCGVRKVADYP